SRQVHLVFVLDREDRGAYGRINRQDLRRLLPGDARAADAAALMHRERRESGIVRHRCARERYDVRIDADLAPALQPLPRTAQRPGEVRERCPRGAQDDVEKRGDAELERTAERPVDVRGDLSLVELTQDLAREALDAEAEYAEAGTAHRRQPLRRHGI